MAFSPPATFLEAPQFLHTAVFGSGGGEGAAEVSEVSEVDLEDAIRCWFNSLARLFKVSNHSST